MFVLRAPITPDDCECLCKPRVTKAAHSPRCFLWAADQKRRSPQPTLRSTMTKPSFCIYSLINFAKASKLLQCDFALYRLQDNWRSTRSGQRCLASVSWRSSPIADCRHRPASCTEEITETLKQEILRAVGRIIREG